MRNDKPILSIIIPVFNEVKTVGEIIGRVAQINIPHEIVVVDDCSTDGTREMLSSIRPRTFRLIFNPSNQGKGACVRKALKKAKGRIVVIQDADLEYFPEEIPKLVEPIISGKADMVIGKRVVLRRKMRRYLWGGRLISAFVSLLYGVKLGDVACCYKALKRNDMERMGLRCDGFDLDFELVCKGLGMGLRVREIPVMYEQRGINEGKKLKVWDGFKAIKIVLECWFTRRLGLSLNNKGDKE